MPSTQTVIFLEHWQKELAQSYTTPESLAEVLSLSPEWLKHQGKARQLFPMRVPRPFVALMEQGNPNDPLLLQSLPKQDEFEQVAGYHTDPLEEQNLSGPTGLLHKYKSRVLIVFRGGCAINCRYCFRRHFPYQDHQIGQAELAAISDYLDAHPEINEVILSGGDPLMAKDKHLAQAIQMLETKPHIIRLRIHSRLPVVLPQRITNEFVALLKNTRLKSILVLHINHPNEIGSQLQAQLLKLKQAGILLLNQSVLLKGVNDSVQVLAQLSEKLFEASILPYYLHQLDKVQGAAHFNVSEAKGKQIMQGLLAELPGFLVPKWVKEVGGERSKTPLHF